METLRQSLILLVVGSLLASCKAPTVNLSTNEPIKVDINMRLDVYQYSSPTTKKPAAPQTTPAGQTPEARRRNRMADIQQFKNERLVGEGHDGLLVILKNPEGEYGDYVRVAIDEENADRMELMKSLAESQKTSLPEIQSKQAELWRNRSFKGEWIETQQPDGSWKWLQKEG
ncbi:MAG: DUF1318 domain-containing protein [Terrimicrobiaceae bacterium]|jgi:uncharacterized protein YdbL (DUF1318 family)